MTCRYRRDNDTGLAVIVGSIIIAFAILWATMLTPRCHGAEPVVAPRPGMHRINNKTLNSERFTLKGWRQETITYENDPFRRPAYLHRDNSGRYWTHAIEVFDVP